MSITLRNAFIALAVLGVAVLGFVFYSQYVQGYRPCEWCLRQRWPWGIVIALGIIGAVRPLPILLWVAGGVLLVGAVFGAIHFGVEQGWWETGCSIGTGSANSIDELRAQLMDAPPCNIVRWRLFGLSMATYNFIVSLGAAILVLLTARTLARARHV